MFETVNCQDCDFVSDNEFIPSNGKCSACNGTGLVSDILDAISKSLVGDSQKCETCNGSGECPTCFGKGYLNV